ncbi:MAG: Flagellar hook-associated protein 3 [Syntrophaceae bacterium PtaB.Bin038]|nr:MAG: Flagellar hook-associated protein 3 [Syntrophaceae bacterium PtaB.Bin038]
MRITENMRYGSLIAGLGRAQGNYSSLMEQMASQKKINRPSDDPVGTTRVLDFRGVRDTIAQYGRNIENADAWLQLSETKLENISDLIGKAREAGINDQSSQTRQVLAQNVGSLLEEILALANSKFGERYLFAGSRTDRAPFERIILPVAHSANGFDGSVFSGGTYTGAAEKTYTVRIASGGALGAATCEVSDDGGATWSAAATVPASGIVSLGDGLTVRFGDDGTTNLTAGDLFYVNAYAGGRTTDARVEAPQAASNNAFAGTVALDASSGPYGGDRNRTYAVQFVNGGGAVGEADYRVSTDGGRTWGAVQTASWGSTITVDDTPGRELVLSFAASGPSDGFAENDLFTVNAYAPGVYSGNGEDLSVATGRGSRMVYNVTGEEAFTDRGRGGVDLFAVLESLKTALEQGDREGVIAQVDRLTAAQNTIRQYVAESGARRSSLDITRANYQVLDDKVAGLMSATEDVDLERLIVEFKMKETALQASYAMSVQIGKMSILNYL